MRMPVSEMYIGVRKMECDTAGVQQDWHEEISNQMKSILIRVGWMMDFREKNTPVLSFLVEEKRAGRFFLEVKESV